MLLGRFFYLPLKLERMYRALKTSHFRVGSLTIMGGPQVKPSTLFFCPFQHSIRTYKSLLATLDSYTVFKFVWKFKLDKYLNCIFRYLITTTREMNVKAKLHFPRLDRTTQIYIF